MPSRRGGAAAPLSATAAIEPRNVRRCIGWSFVDQWLPPGCKADLGRIKLASAYDRGKLLTTVSTRS